jgi:hypothetical protein
VACEHYKDNPYKMEMPKDEEQVNENILKDIRM